MRLDFLSLSFILILETRPDPTPKALVRIREITGAGDKELSWQDAYDIEQQLVHLYDASTLKVELERRLLEADAALHPSVLQWYKDRVGKVTDEDERRALLARLINDLQWHYTRNETRRGYTKQVTGRTELLFVATVGLFLLFVLSLLSYSEGAGLSENHRGLVPFVGIAGAFGASFSMLTSLKTRLAESSLDDLKLNRSVLMILAQVLVGMGAGFVLFFFIKSGLLGGEAFPEFGTALGEETVRNLSAPDFAKLFIWCFISGFSEKLIPNLLATTERQQSAQQAPPAQIDEPRSIQPVQKKPRPARRAGTESVGAEEQGEEKEQ